MNYKIQIASVTRELPLREVSPGVSVALFDILGDWELTECRAGALS
jgi:adenine phosphoribosyltransferase